MAARGASWLLLLAAAGAAAQDAEQDALALADRHADAPAAASDWRGLAELAVGGPLETGDGRHPATRRLSLDLRAEHALSPRWRWLIADRLDWARPAAPGADNAVNTLKEAYLSARLRPDTLLDVGRINVRQGVATGFNPTDYFRDGALRSVVSIQPSSLKENRQGSVMLRAQQLWDAGSLTALWSPALADGRRASGESVDLGATNRRDRGLLALSLRDGALNPQALLFGQAGQSPRVGLNLNGLIGDATVAFAEWSGGREAAHLAQALAASAAPTWSNQLSSGLSYTHPRRVTLGVEYQYDGAAADERSWQALRQGPPGAYAAYRQWVQRAQVLPTRRALLVHASWQDAATPGLDLSGLFSRDLVDASARAWLEARYHVEAWEWALQWQADAGSPWSVYGATAQRRSMQLALRRYW